MTLSDVHLNLQGKNFVFKNGKWMIEDEKKNNDEESVLIEKNRQLKIEQSDLNLKIDVALRMA
jgi:hypothetical protein